MKKIFSGMMLAIFAISLSASAFIIQPVKASGTVYIRADGTVDPLMLFNDLAINSQNF